jgi:hypothetical protein
MFRRNPIRQSVPLVLCVAAAVLCTTQGSAKGKPAKPKKPNACVLASQTGQEHVESGHLRDARESFSGCAKTACGALQKKCAAQVTQLDSAIASVAPVVTDESGAPITDVQVKVDGEAWARRLDGHVLLLDPGVHEFSFRTDAGLLASQKVMIVEGQRGPLSFSLSSQEKRLSASVARHGETSLRPAATDQQPADKGDKPAAEGTSVEGAASGGHWALPTSAFPYVLTGVGLASVGAGVLLTIWGNRDNDVAAAQCHGNCPASTADHIKTLYLASDISLGVGIASLGVATWIFAGSHSAEKESPSPAVTSFAVQPVRSGAFASVTGSF